MPREQYQPIGTSEETPAPRTNWKRRAIIGTLLTVCALAVAAVTLFGPRHASFVQDPTFALGSERFASGYPLMTRSRSFDNQVSRAPGLAPPPAFSRMPNFNSPPSVSHQAFGMPVAPRMDAFKAYNARMAPPAAAAPTGRYGLQAWANMPESVHASRPNYYNMRGGSREFAPVFPPGAAFQPVKPVEAFGHADIPKVPAFAPQREMYKPFGEMPRRLEPGQNGMPY